MGIKYVELTKEDLELFEEIPEEIQKEMKGLPRVSEALKKGDVTFGKDEGWFTRHYMHILGKLQKAIDMHKKHSEKIMSKVGYVVPEPVPNKEYLVETWFDWETYLFSEFACIIYDEDLDTEGFPIQKASRFAIERMKEYLDKLKTWDFAANKGEFPKVTKE